ncbi:thioesterase family protein [Sphingorhabdus sp. Alg239-R122]|uniref:acyl-CoA thioesterase n=1 Tax=Sphingorhabdus sp. Alg239-R122 TaxID=2305989 RepID=UPI0013DB27DA|nr:thioesterase family protein [Sphingorhabdus sp. Alg239-R122]
MINSPDRSDFAIFAPKRVRYHEVDIQNVVFNGHYLTFADIAVTEYFRELGGDGGWESVNFFGPDGDVMVRHSALDFRGSAKADDVIDMGVRVAEIGNSSFVFQIAMFRGDELLCVVTSTYVHFLKESGRPAPVPDRFRGAIAGFEKIKPNQG